MQHLLGTHIIVGITFKDQSEQVIRQFQTHGRVISADPQAGIVIDKADGSGPFGLPPQPDAFEPARPGDYRLRSTGEVVTDPDYTTSWTVADTRPENVKKYESIGFGPFNREDE